MGKKIETTTTAGHNLGIHDTKAYKKACDMLDNHTFTNAQLWHMVVTNLKAEDRFNEDRKAHEQALQQVVDKLRDSGMEVKWKAAYELCPTKGFHRHIFLLIESKEHKPAGILRYRPDGWLVKHLAGYGLGFHLARPKNAIHCTSKGYPKKYAYVPKTPGPMLEDCKDWISYIYKVRTKADVAAPIYSSSRKKATKANEVTPTTNEGEQMTTITLTEAGHAYVSGFYKRFTAKEMNVAEIRRALSDNGIPRTLHQVREDLTRYGYPEYAATHEGSLPPTLREVAEREEGKKAKPARRLEFKLCPDYEASKRNSIADSIRRAAH